jgi:hypothetical protein
MLYKTSYLNVVNYGDVVMLIIVIHHVTMVNVVMPNVIILADVMMGAIVWRCHAECHFTER